MQREAMEVDVLIVGAGPAGLSAAIRLKQLQPELQVCVLEKGAEVGSHILSGAVLEPRALNELLPNWQDLGAPLNTPVTEDSFYYFTKKSAWRLPTPSPMKNHGNYIISLADFCRWLGQQAEQLGVEIFPGFAAAEILFAEDGQVKGVATGDMGVTRDGQHSEHYQPGMELHAKQTLFSEGCRGSLTEQLIQHFDLRKNCSPQTYGIGVKELWEVKPEKHKAGSVAHSIGWPLDNTTYGGSFIYHLDQNRVAIGFVIGLDYKNPYLSPFDEMQRFKTHPKVRELLTGGQRLCYGARALNEGGWQAIPKLTFPGGAIIGCGAGFLNVPKIKGTHTAMKSGMLAAEAVVEAIIENQAEATAYSEALQNSWVWGELYAVRNIRPAFYSGLWPALLYSAFDTYVLRGKAPWTFKIHADHTQLLDKNTAKPITYPKPDGTLTFDKPSSVYCSNVYHAEDQPCHLTLKDTQVPININFNRYASPEQRYCPAGVYEIVYTEDNQARLQINAQNCIHCKTCDIKDPTQNIVWVTPEGGGGPNYTSM